MSNLEELAVHALTETQIEALDGKRVEWFDGPPVEAPRRRGRPPGSKSKRPAVWIGVDSMHPVRDGIALERRELRRQRSDAIRRAHHGLRACATALADPRFVKHTMQVCEETAENFGLTYVELYGFFMRKTERALRRRELAELGGGQ
jgi:hypothetical protein